MKIRTLFASAMASLLMAGCSQDEVAPVEGGGNDGNGEATISYMAVNLKSPIGTAGRATVADGYEDGDVNENTVTKVRFYFFDGTGGIANVKLNGNSYVNYYDWTNPAQNNDTENDNDIEKILTATIVINTKEGDKLPQKMVAAINPPTNSENKIVWGDGAMSLTELQKVSSDYAANNLTTEGNFVMFNSIYVSGSTEVNAVPITTENLQTTPDLAEKNPVTIFVERSVAKVKVSIATQGYIDGTVALKTKGDDGKETDILVGGKKVYLKLLGWDLTADTDKGRLVKRINAAWPNNWWKGEHRTFWAINELSAINRYHSYTDIPAAGFASPKYTNENAGKNDINGTSGNAKADTKVILKGTLCDEDGKPFTIVRHLGAYFADTYNATDESENLKALKDNILSQLVANGLNYYYETTEIPAGKTEPQTVRKQIDKGDLKIVIATPVTAEEQDNNCYVYAQLTDAAEAKTWYDTLDEGTEDNPVKPIAYSKINTSLSSNVDKALVWQSGMTYYYYAIKHLPNDDKQEQPGVVRNHIYDTNVTKILGLGTPVYDPDEKIYPEKPSKNDHYIAAEIKILSWRVVQNDYILDWN